MAREEGEGVFGFRDFGFRVAGFGVFLGCLGILGGLGFRV